MTTQTSTPAERTPAPRELWPQSQTHRPGYGQAHIWGRQLEIARDVVEAAHQELARRVNRQPLSRKDIGPQRDLPLNPHYTLDTAFLAVVSEALVEVAGEVDELKAQVAALEAAPENAR